MAKKKFKVKAKESLADRIIGGLGVFFKGKAKIINLNEDELPPKCIMIGNHNGAGGPFAYRTSLDKRFMSWGAHQMCEGYRSRFKYLFRTFYMQKLHYGKVKAWIIALLFSIISKIVYGYAGIVPIYYDSRIFNTYKYSIECLDKDVSLLIFPENSTDGYKVKIEEFWSGFLNFSKVYYNKFGVDLPVYTMYYCNKKKNRSITIGKPVYMQELLKDHTDEEVLEICRKYMNQLGGAE